MTNKIKNTKKKKKENTKKEEKRKEKYKKIAVLMKPSTYLIYYLSEYVLCCKLFTL